MFQIIIAWPADTDEQRLMKYLLRNYEKSVRPVRNASTAILVKLGLTLTHILDLVGIVVFKIIIFLLKLQIK